MLALTEEPGAVSLQGWSPNETIYHELAAKANATVMIEVGVWKGLSASHLASYLRKEETGDRGGVLFAGEIFSLKCSVPFQFRFTEMFTSLFLA